MKKLIYTLICLWGVIACSPQTAVSTIDGTVQQKTDSLLKETLNTCNADWGVAIVMEVETGKVIAQVAIERKDNMTFVGNNTLLSTPMEPGSMFIPVSMLIALDGGVVGPSDSIDTENGRIYAGGITVNDSKGFGMITASQVVGNSSNVGIANIVSKGYGENPALFRENIRRLGWDSLSSANSYGTMIKMRAGEKIAKADLLINSFGYALEISPVGMLTFYNAVANNGKMVLPQTEYRSTVVLNEAIASPEAIKSLQTMLREVIESETGSALRSDNVSIVGKIGTAMVANGRNGYADRIYSVSSCVYFPAEKPKYTCIVTLYNPKESYPSAGLMTGQILRIIAKSLCGEGS